MPREKLPKPAGTAENAKVAVFNAIERLIGNIPETQELKSADPTERARSIANAAAARAALVSGGLAIPPGPLGYLTILPDLLAVWKIQSQMVADVAGTFGQSASLTREKMIFCLFKHAAAQVVRDLVARVGSRVIVKRVSLRVMQQILEKITIRVSQRVIAKSIARWLPVVGAVGVGAYAYFDTASVGKTAIEFFGKEPKPFGGSEKQESL